MTLDELASERTLDLETARKNLWVAFTALMDDALREGKKIKDIAEGIGVTPRTILSYTKQQNFNPTFDVLFNISRYFNAPIDWMIGKYDLDERSLDTVEKYFGISQVAAVNLNRLLFSSEGEAEDELADIDRFDPPMLAESHGELCFVITSDIIQHYIQSNSQDDDSIEPPEDGPDLNHSRQLSTLNEVLEDWTLIPLINAYCHSIPAELCNKDSMKRYPPICFDSVILDLIEDELRRMRKERWEDLSQYAPGSRLEEVR